MPPIIALLGSYALIIWLFKTDFTNRRRFSKSLIIPGLYLFILASRPVGYWFHIGSFDSSEFSNVEGDSTNLIVFGLLIISALFCLINRPINWDYLIRKNVAIVLLYAYFGASVIWSDYPIASLKRWVRDFSLILVALLLLTDRTPGETIRMLFIRISYIIFPLSIVLIKYYPSIGRTVSHSGDYMASGICTHKNTLGEVIMILSFIIVWELLELKKKPPSNWVKMRKRVCYGLIGMAAWLLFECDSKTSLLCLVVGLVVFWLSGMLSRFNNPRAAVFSGLLAVIILVGLDSSLNIREKIAISLGRDPSLTGRTKIWESIQKQKIDPIFGCGFLVFWDRPVAKEIFRDINATINTAHNGYLDLYLDGGWIGVFLIGAMIVVSGWKIINRMAGGSVFGRIGFSIMLMAILYNLSESSFLRLDPLWFSVLLVSLQKPGMDKLDGTEAVPDLRSAVAA